MLNKRLKQYFKINTIKVFTLCMLIPLTQIIYAQQDSVSLSEMYKLAEVNYPLTKRRGLIEKSKEYSLDNAATGYYPKANIYGQATYQSEVTEIPIEVPGVEVPSLSKDQYKIYGEVTLNLYNGGIIEKKQDMIRAEANKSQDQLDVQLYSVKKRVIQLYFGILLMDAQLEANRLYRKDITIGIKNIRSAVENGVALESELKRLKAQLLKVEQQAFEIKSTRTSYVEMLELFTGTEIDSETEFMIPPSDITIHNITRPRLDVFESQINIISQKDELLTAQNRPKINLFLQGGFGKPALNFLSNEFDGYYIGGIRLKIPLSGYYTLKKEHALLDIKKSDVNLRKNVFLLNTKMKITKNKNKINKFMSLLETDNHIIDLRESVKETLASQLKYGVVNTSDYLLEVIKTNQARQNKNLHKIQLLMTQYELKWTSGHL